MTLVPTPEVLCIRAVTSSELKRLSRPTTLEECVGWEGAGGRGEKPGMDPEYKSSMTVPTELFLCDTIIDPFIGSFKSNTLKVFASKIAKAL